MHATSKSAVLSNERVLACYAHVRLMYTSRVSTPANLSIKHSNMSGRVPSAPPLGGVSVGGGSSTGRAIFALCGGLAGAYYGFYLQSKYMEERRVRPHARDQRTA